MKTAGALLRTMAAGLMVLMPVACVDLTPPWEKASFYDAAGRGGAGGPETGGSLANGGAIGGGGATDAGPSGAGGSSGGLHAGSFGEEPDAAQGDRPLPAPDGPLLVDTPVPTSSTDAGGTTAGDSPSATGGAMGIGGAGASDETSASGGTSGGASASGGTSGGASASGGTTATSSVVNLDAGVVAPPDAGVVAPPDAGPFAKGLLVYYTFESIRAGLVPDQSGNDNDGTLRSDATDAGVVSGHLLGAGKVGRGLALLRRESGYIAMPPVPFRGLTEITIATWVKILSVTNWQRLFDIGVDLHSPFNPRTGSKYMNLAPEAESDMSFGISKDGFSNERAITTTSPAAGAWTHLAVVLAADGSGKLYVDGALAASDPALGLHPSDLGSIDYAYIGKSPFSKDPYLDAVIDEFRVYGRALSPAEVSALYRFTAP